MPITIEELDKYLELIEETEAHPDRLTDWEINFLPSIKEVLLIYKESSNISEKQEAILERIEKKMYAT